MSDLYNEISRKGRKRKVTMQIPRWILELKLITGWDCLCKLALSHVYLEQTILLYVQDLDLISCILRTPSIQCISYSGITIRKSSLTNLFYCVLRTTGTLHSSEYFLSSRFLDIAMQLIPKQVISRVNFNIYYSSSRIQSIEYAIKFVVNYQPGICFISQQVAFSPKDWNWVRCIKWSFPHSSWP